MSKKRFYLAMFALCSVVVRASIYDCKITREDFVDVPKGTSLLKTEVGSLSVDTTKSEVVPFYVIDNVVEKAVVICHGNLCGSGPDSFTCSFLSSREHRFVMDKTGWEAQIPAVTCPSNADTNGRLRPVQFTSVSDKTTFLRLGALYGSASLYDLECKLNHVK